MQKKLLLVCSALVLGASSLFAKDAYIPDLNWQLQNNKELIKSYKEAVKKLEEKNKYLLQQKQLHKSLYSELPLYESTKKAYIYRIKLNGEKPNNINFNIKNHMLSVEMEMESHHSGKEGYFESAQYFYRSFTVPSDVIEKKISHKLSGDYFVITMPKKQK
jgi:HSP20 family molecular chaperone IbpA